MSALPITQIVDDAEASPRLRLARSRLTCEPLSTPIALEHAADEWETLVRAVRAPMCVGPAWCRVWHRTYGRHDALRVFRFWDGNDLVGVVPMAIRWMRLGPVRLRLATLIGSDLAPAALDLPVRTDWIEVVVDELLQRLVHDDRCDVVLFRGLAATSPATTALVDTCRQRTDLVEVERDRYGATASTLALPASVEAFRRALSPAYGTHLRRSWRRLAQRGDARVEIAGDLEAAAEEFHELVRQHERQWRGRGHFTMHPGAEPQHRGLVRSLSATGDARLLQLRVGRRVVARRYALISGPRALAPVSARHRGAEWDSCSLGCLSMCAMLEHLIESGVEHVELGRGSCESERRVGASTVPLRSILVTARRIAHRPDVRVFCAAARSLERGFELGLGRVVTAVPPLRRLVLPAWARTRLG